MELALAGVALLIAVFAMVLIGFLRRKVADLQAGLHAANAALAKAEVALAEQTSAALERALRTNAETRSDLEARIANAAAQAAETAKGLDARISTAQNETRHALEELRSQQESGDAAVVGEVAELIEHQKEFLRSDLEARLAEREAGAP